MEREEFLKAQEAPPEVARKAWEEANGNSDYATELLTPEEITIKGKFGDEESNLHGLLLVKWDLRSDDLIGVRGVVVNVSLDDMTATQTSDDFYKRISELENSSNLLSGYTDSVKKPIKDLLNDPNNDYPECLLEDDLNEFNETLLELLQDSLDLRNLDLQVDTDVRRRIDKEPEDEPSDEGTDEEKVNVPSCDVHVTPVQGVSVEKLQTGDMIYVEIGEIPDEWSKLEPVLEDLRDDSGLIPAQLKGKEQSEDGRLKLQVQFGKNVYGTVNCGRDVSLMVPDDTLEKYENEGTIDFDDFSTASVLGVAGAVVLVALLLVLLIS